MCCHLTTCCWHSLPLHAASQWKPFEREPLLGINAKGTSEVTALEQSHRRTGAFAENLYRRQRQRAGQLPEGEDCSVTVSYTDSMCNFLKLQRAMLCCVEVYDDLATRYTPPCGPGCLLLALKEGAPRPSGVVLRTSLGGHEVICGRSMQCFAMGGRGRLRLTGRNTCTLKYCYCKEARATVDVAVKPLGPVAFRQWFPLSLGLHP